MAKWQRKWKDNAVRVKRLDADACGREMDALAAQGMLTPEKLVDHARSPDSALHDGFTWDDSVAAHRYRLTEAGQIIRAIVHVEEVDDGQREVRCFVNVKDPEQEMSPAVKGYYVGTEDALQDARYRRYILDTALADAQAFNNKYRHLSELAQIVSAIDATVREFELVHTD